MEVGEATLIDYSHISSHIVMMEVGEATLIDYPYTTSHIVMMEVGGATLIDWKNNLIQWFLQEEEEVWSAPNDWDPDFRQDFRQHSGEYVSMRFPYLIHSVPHTFLFQFLILN